MSIDDQIKLLTKNEMTVLYWKCRGLTHEQIRLRLTYSKDWVQLQMSTAYRKLGFDKDMHWTRRVEILKNEVCPRLTKKPEDMEASTEITEEFIEENKEETIEGKADPEMMALVLYDEKMLTESNQLNEKKNQSKKETEIIEIPSTLPRRSCLPTVIMGIIGFGLLIAVGYGAYVFGRNSAAQVTPEIQVITATFPPTALESTTPAFTETSLPTLTLTSEPTLTPLPTATPFVPPADGILFQDDFESGDLSAWTQLTGKWLVSDGKLTILADENTGSSYQWISLNKPEWHNYILSIDLNKSYNNGVAVSVRDNSSTQPIGFEIGWADDIQLVLISDNWTSNTQIAGNSGADVAEKTNVNIQLEVQDDTYTLRLNSREVQKVTYTGYTSGGIAFGVSCTDDRYGCTTFDNVKVTYLP